MSPVSTSRLDSGLTEFRRGVFIDLPDNNPELIALHSDPVPLRTDIGGVIRVGNSRISLDLVIENYVSGMTPEEMVRAYKTLQLAEVYATIAYYLRHKTELKAYLKRREEEDAAIRTKIEAEQTHIF